MKCKAVYLVKAVTRPGQQHATTATHFPAKAGFDVELDERTGWVSIRKDGETRMTPPHNVVYVIPFEEESAKAEPKAPAKAPPQKKVQPGVES